MEQLLPSRHRLNTDGGLPSGDSYPAKGCNCRNRPLRVQRPTFRLHASCCLGAAGLGGKKQQFQLLGFLRTSREQPSGRPIGTAHELQLTWNSAASWARSPLARCNRSLRCNPGSPMFARIRTPCPRHYIEPCKGSLLHAVCVVQGHVVTR
jgi:hypothetical protein